MHEASVASEILEIVQQAATAGEVQKVISHYVADWSVLLHPTGAFAGCLYYHQSGHAGPGGRPGDRMDAGQSLVQPVPTGISDYLYPAGLSCLWIGKQANNRRSGGAGEIY